MLKRFGNFMLSPVVFIACFAAMFAFQIIGILFGTLILGIPMDETTPIAVFTGHMGFILVFGLWYAFGLKKYTYAKKSVKKIATPKNIAGIVVLSLGLAFFMSFGLALADPFIPEAIVERYVQLMEEAQLGENLFTNLAGCFLAPIGEELIFRGVMMYFLVKSIKGLKSEKVLFWVVNFVQAVAFGAFHMNMYQGMYATVLGMLIGYMAYKCDTILVPILIHMVYNILQIVLMEPVGNALPENTVVYALLFVAGFVVMVIGMCMMKLPKEEDTTEEIAA